MPPEGLFTRQLLNLLPYSAPNRARVLNVAPGRRPRPRPNQTGGRKPELTGSQVKHVRQLYADGNHTVAQIAVPIGVSRQTICEALEPEAVGS